MDRRSLLAGLGMASCTALTASLMLPTVAKAHHGHGGHGHGHGNCGGNPKDVVWGLMGALETLDVEEIASWLHEDVVFQNIGLPDLVGLEAATQFIGPFSVVFESLTVDVVSMVSDGHLVCTERTEHYVVSASSPVGNPGAEVTIRVAGWHEVDDGKVIRWSDFGDHQAFVSALGIPLPMA